jgi:hypothetical protein
MKTSIRAILTLFTLALFLGACLPASSGQPQDTQAQNTQSPQDVQSEVETAVAQTIEAQNQVGTFVAQTMEAQATATFTVTPITIPTLTPFVISTPTNRPGGNGGGGAPPKPDYACDVIHVRPYDNTEILHGQGFDIKWTILNTGAKIWPAGKDLKYYSGPKMTSAGTVQIPELDPNEQFSVVFDATAPDEPGLQVMTWVVEGQLCFPYVAIIVTR